MKYCTLFRAMLYVYRRSSILSSIIGLRKKHTDTIKNKHSGEQFISFFRILGANTFIG